MGTLNDAHSFAACIFRGTRGLSAARPATHQPEQLLELFEFESCPYCRKVREVLCEMDLEYISRTCARGSANREVLIARAGKSQYPYLIDPNTGTEMYESEDIITYLRETYGNGRSSASKLLSPFNTFTASISSVVRPSGGVVGPVGQRSEQLLELYGFEASPFCRKVREALCRLDLDYVVRNVAKRSARRPDLVERGGKMMVPYLIDPNTGSELYESDDIVDYLDQTYG